MAAKLHNQPRIEGIQALQRIAHMQPLNRPAGAFERTVACRRKGDNRAMKTLFDTRGQNTDNALVPLRVVHRQAAG
ncbi:Uncharacterised protein [Klebsiella pneumoniae]|nr:Uncharacterised protein [Klebsiella pneumoniae]